MRNLVVHGGARKDFVEMAFVSLLFLAVTLVSACSTPEIANAEQKIHQVSRLYEPVLASKGGESQRANQK